MLVYKALVVANRQLNRLVNIPLPRLEMGAQIIEQSGRFMTELNGSKVLVVTDKTIQSLGLTTSLFAALSENNISYSVYDEVQPNPTISAVEQGVALFRQEQCDAIVAIGGGSPIDCAKAIGARVVRDKPIRSLAGRLRIRKALPPFIAIPTTAGTGSEATVAAVISDPIRRDKFTLVDPVLVPNIALIDPNLMTGLPAAITATTGIDALTHAVEAYIGTNNTELTDQYATSAIKRIFNNLDAVFEDGNNIDAREEMALASYEAGCAFTRTYVGYVHAFAHQLGGMYNTPHGLANALLLPNVLHLLKDDCQERLTQLAVLVGLSSAEQFIEAIESLNKRLAIPQSFPELKKEDISLLTKRALKEAHGTYPVPGYLTQAQGERLLEKYVAAT